MPPRHRARRAAPGEKFTLTCGAPIRRRPVDSRYPYPRAFPRKSTASMLPMPSGSAAPKADTECSTGCGATVHMKANVSRGRSEWYGDGDAVGHAVVLLPPEYFTEREKMQLDGIPKKDECGCVTVGVGCCVCGNALGSVTARCEQHFTSGTLRYPTTYTFLPEAVSPPLPLPPVIKRVERHYVEPPRSSISAPASSAAEPTDVTAAPTEPFVPLRRLFFDFSSFGRDLPRRPSPTPSELEADIMDDVDDEAEAEEALRQAALARFAEEGDAPRTQEALQAWTKRAMGVYARISKRAHPVER